MLTIILALLALPSCQVVHTVAPADTLSGLAQFYFADASYGRAILLATNARSGEPGFQRIGDPNSVTVGSQVCIPELPEQIGDVCVTRPMRGPCGRRRCRSLPKSPIRS
jgi:hypothetical protein